MGTIIGFDLNPFLALAEARGYPVVLIAELLQAAECGMLEGYAKYANIENLKIYL